MLQQNQFTIHKKTYIEFVPIRVMHDKMPILGYRFGKFAYITDMKSIVTAETKKAMKKVLSDIQDGTFAKDFLLDMSDAGGQVHFKAMRKLAAEHQSEKVGAEIRKLYSWSDEDKLINN